MALVELDERVQVARVAAVGKGEIEQRQQGHGRCQPGARRALDGEPQPQRRDQGQATAARQVGSADRDSRQQQRACIGLCFRQQQRGAGPAQEIQMLAVQFQTFEQHDARDRAQRDDGQRLAAAERHGAREGVDRRTGQHDQHGGDEMRGGQRRTAAAHGQQPRIERWIDAVRGELGRRGVGRAIGRIVVGGQEIDRIVAAEISEQGAAARPPQRE